MLIVARLGYEDVVMSTAGFDKVVAADILHDLRAGEDLGVEDLLELVQRLRVVSVSSSRPASKASSRNAAAMLTCSSRF